MTNVKRIVCVRRRKTKKDEEGKTEEKTYFLLDIFGCRRIVIDAGTPD